MKEKYFIKFIEITKKKELINNCIITPVEKTISLL